jgi:LPS-assembly protein
LDVGDTYLAFRGLKKIVSRETRNSLSWRQMLLRTVVFCGGGSALLVMLPGVAHAQFRAQPLHVNTGKTSSSDEPVTFQADHVSYDEHAAIVTWTGNVQVWQGDRVMRADTMTYDRNTGIVVAKGHVASTQPDGSVLFSDYAELTGSMRDGVMMKISTLMEDNARFAANGLRRTNGKINDMSRAVYTACIICQKDPSRAPFWQFRAYDATQDLEHQRIDFRDAYFDILGVPVVWLPFFSMVDPSAKRKSGFLMPGITPHDRYLGTYFTIPYYWVIDGQSDMTTQLLVSTRTGPQLKAQYRNSLNFGSLKILGALAYDTLSQEGYRNGFGEEVKRQKSNGIQGFIDLQGRATISREWRAGVNVRLATSANYMRDYRLQGYGQDTLNSNAYLEGFGTGSYSRVDTQFYQGLNRGVMHDSQLPFVLPAYQYAFLGQPDALGGRFGLETRDFDVYRSNGTRDQRGELAMHWDRPFLNSWGQKYLLTLRLDSMLYHASNLWQQPNYYVSRQSVTRGQVLPTVAVKMNWPFLRSFARGHGSQILEPIVQAIYAPNTGDGSGNLLPNEDSFAYEFTDSTLFSLNRWQGTDRLDGGLRANVGVHGSWTWNGHVVDVLVGESFQQHIQRDRLPYSGLDHHISDVVGRARVAPNQHFQFVARGRISPQTGKFDFGDALFSANVRHFALNGGYVYEPVTPFYYYAQDYRDGSPANLYYRKMNEITGGVSTNWESWHASGFARRSLSRKQFVSLGANIGYQNDCFGFDFMYLKQYTTIGGQQRNSSFLFTLTLKTIGAFGIK